MNFILIVILYYLACVKFPVQVNSFVGWIIAAMIVAIAIAFVLLIGNFIFNRRRCTEIYMSLKNKIKKEE